MTEYVVVGVTCSSGAVLGERRFARTLTLEELQGRLELITGVPVAEQRLQLHNAQGRLLRELAEAEPLAADDVASGRVAVHVIDQRPATGREEEPLDEEVSLAMSDEAYDQRAGTVRAFKRAHGLGRFGSSKPGAEEATAAADASLAVGARCEVRSQEAFPRRGRIAYLGPTRFRPGPVWVGVHLDEPVGKNDGSVDGVRYFDCPPRHGVFVLPSAVHAGDFPELDLDDDEEGEEDLEEL